MKENITKKPFTIIEYAIACVVALFIFHQIASITGLYEKDKNEKKLKVLYTNIQSVLSKSEIPNSNDVLNFLSASYNYSGKLEGAKTSKYLRKKTSLTIDGIALDHDLSFFYEMQKNYSHKKTKEEIKNYLLLLQLNRLKEKYRKNLEQLTKKIKGGMVK